ASGDAVLDEGHALLGSALEVEGLRQAAGVERVVADRHLLVEDLLAETAGEVAALLEQAEPAERIPREILQQLAQGVRLEHRAVHARLESLRARRPARLLGRFRGA